MAMEAEHPAGPAAEEATAPGRVRRLRARRRWFDNPVLVIVAITAIAGGLRFYHLSTPHVYVFDEVYYAKDGCYDAGFNYKDCKLDHPGEQTVTVHPPLGRWIIAGGEAAFGNRPFGWRFSLLGVSLLFVLSTVVASSLLRALTIRGRRHIGEHCRAEFRSPPCKVRAAHGFGSKAGCRQILF